MSKRLSPEEKDRRAFLRREKAIAKKAAAAEERRWASMERHRRGIVSPAWWRSVRKIGCHNACTVPDPIACSGHPGLPIGICVCPCHRLLGAIPDPRGHA